MAWLKCTASSGQFNNEYAISGKNYKGETFSLFVSRRDAQVPGEWMNDEADAFLRVVRLDAKDDLVLVRLPGQTFGNGSSVTVREGDLVETVELEPA